MPTAIGPVTFAAGRGRIPPVQQPRHGNLDRDGVHTFQQHRAMRLSNLRAWGVAAVRGQGASVVHIGRSSW
jgi:hypothetical protein